MANMLGDGSVVPSFLSARSGGFAQDTGQLSNTTLRVGEVKEIVYPGEKNNKTNFIQYTVDVQQVDGSSSATVTSYPGCTLSSIFGGGSDVFHYTLRADKSAKTRNSASVLGVGSKVVLLCINGRTNQALILGGIRDSEAKSHNKDSKEDGHNLYFEFNGMSFAINKDGEIKLQVKGATDPSGAVTSAVPQQPTIEILKDGRVYIKSVGVYSGDATDATMLGDTYRNSETELHNQLMVDLTALAAQVGAAGAGLTSAAPQMAIPVVGGALAAPFVAASGAALTSAVANITKMVADIATFEAKALTYLSKKNKSD